MPSAKTIRAPLSIVVLLLVCGSAFPWGQTGHRVVGRIAENHLAPSTAEALADLLGPDSLAEVSTWADEIKSDPAWEHADPWHYVNIPDGARYAAARRNPRGDVITALRGFESTLRRRNATAEERVAALKFLVHLVADVHQPLHVGRPDDRGGTDLRVSWFGRPTNLHAVWDHHMVNDTKLSFSEYAAFIDDASPDQITRWQNSTYLDWVEESMAVRESVYAVGDGDLRYAYWDRQRPLVERRLLQAGARLAGLLDSIFAP
ncbi:MAG: S1/P1 nuclease [Gammaproteobacteria bacterium]|nr:S1/P1 nuclease [Gammaproteobacteria bacterium]NIR81639.1 S1/P1 nuclease [Gammaproteobacteria bacterium]NIR88190.1 S1/P1 nuclease [Gammaproteobacteria bacterium]NIU02751.1 S1/P1 nuclease [Gammaproteobacteria bacterium]NIV73350.1 S1/P1 Nuclease [Gammaproteobacteria bacterium]